MAVGVILAVVAAVSALASAAQQAESQKQAAKQSNYDAEFEAQQLKQQAEQERLNDEQARKVEARSAEAAKRKRFNLLTASGGGVGVSTLAELSRQASIDELNVQNATLMSQQRRKALGLSATNALISGKARSGALRAQSRATVVSGIGQAAGAGAGTYRNA